MKFLTLASILILLSSPLALAYNGWGYGFSPSQLFENEWFMFGLIFLVFFAITFFALSRSMRENLGAVAVISAVIGLFAALAISQRARFYGYLGGEIGGWVLVLVLILGFILFIKVITNLVGGIGLFVILFASWFLLQRLNPYDFLPYEFLSSDFLFIYEFLVSTTFLIILVIVTALIFAAAYVGGNKTILDWIWARGRERDIRIPLR
ncbi:MAG: hypothetical protein AABX71_02230 [Nanoarchaeota archaeon]